MELFLKLSSDLLTGNVELYQLFIAPPQAIPELEQLEPVPEERLEQNLAAIAEIEAIAQASDTKFVLVLTPLLREFELGSTENELAARKALQELVTAESPIISIYYEFGQIPPS